MAMTPSQLSIIVKSQGIEKASQDLDKLAQAAASVDAETKVFVIAQSKLAESNKKVSQSSEATARGITTQELAMIKLHEQALKMNSVLDRQHASQQKFADNVFARALKEQEINAKKAEDAIAKHNKELDKQAEALKKSSNHGSIFNNTLKSMFVAATAYVGINFAANIIKEADGWGMMQSKLKLAVGSMEGAQIAQRELFDMSQRLRVPLEDSVKLYTRMVVPLQKIGQTSADVQKVVESFSTALKLSGATGQEASSAMLQLSQSFNAGRLNGGEFNSVAEASPNVLRAIEVELVRVGKGADLSSKGLKKLAADGIITTEVMTEALKRAAPKWQKEFESLPITVDGVLTRIKNAWQKAIGEMAQDTKFNEKLAAALMKIEEMLPSLAKTIGNAFIFIVNNGEMLIKTFGYIVAVLTAAKGIEAAYTFVELAKSIGLVTAAGNLLGLTPIGKVILGISAVVGAGILLWNKYTDSIKEVTDKTEANKSKIPDLIKSIEEETRALNARNETLEMELGLRKQLSAADSSTGTPLKKEDLTKYQQALYDLNMARVNVEEAKKAFSSRKSNVGAEALQQAITDSEQNFRAASINIIAARKAYDAMKEASNVESGNAFLVNRQKTSEALIQQYKTQNEKAEDIRKKALDKLNQDNATGLVTATAYAKAKLGIERDYQESLEKIKKTPDVTHQITNLDKVNKLIEEQNSLNKEWEQDGLKKLSVGEKFRIQVLSENDAYIKLLASGKIEGKLMTEKERLQILSKMHINDEAVARSKIVESMQKVRELNQADAKRIDKAFEDLTTEEEKLAVLKRQLELGEQTNIAKQQQSVIEAEIALSAVIQSEKWGDELIAAQKTLKVRQDTLKVMQGLEAKDAAEAEAKKYEDAYQAANKKIADGLYNAIGKGGESAIKKLIQDIKSWFARLVLSPIINPISQLGASIISPNAASAQGVGGIAGTVSNVLNIGNTAEKIGSAIGATIFGNSVSYASSISGLSSIGAGSQAAMLAAQTGEFGAAGLAATAQAGAGAVGATGIGATLSGFASTLSTIAPYLAAAALLYKGLSMGEKQKTGTTVTGNLGTQDLMRNVSWTQQGGFLRSDRSGTWSYGLKDSTAIQDGKAYTDPANMASDKALLAQLTSMYDALKVSTTDLAKSLGMSADSIKDRTDSINFAFGKDAQETSANINKAFESVANVIAGDLLGSLSILAKVGESSFQTLTRLSSTMSSVNGIFKALGYQLFTVNDSGVKAADSLVTLYGGLEKFQQITQTYYDNFYSDAEKTEKALAIVKKAIKDLGVTEDISSREAFRARVEKARADGDEALAKSLMELSGAFAQVVQWSDDATNSLKKLPQKVQDTFDTLAKSAEKWLSIRNQAMSLKDSINEALTGTKKDPAARIKQLWDALSSDVSPEQKLQLAGELKDLVLSKYQTEKENVQKLIEYGKQLKGYVDGLKVGSLSPLTMTEKLAEAQRQYQDTLTKAQGGDTIAQGALTGKADAYLQIAQTALAGSSGYQEIFSNITSSLDALGIDAMTSSTSTDAIIQNQLDELTKLRDFAESTEKLANTYYVDSLKALTDQLNVMNQLYIKMGDLAGISTTIASLPAEIATLIKGQVGASSNTDFIKSLYGSYAGKFGDMVDPAGFSYWMSEVEKFGRDYATKAFQSSVQALTSAPVVNNANQEMANLKSELSAVVEELKGLRADQQAQTGDVIAATVMSNKENADAIIEQTLNTTKDKSWAESSVPVLV